MTRCPLKHVPPYPLARFRCPSVGDRGIARSFAPMYRPVTISAFAALVAVCDMCYWRQVENMPEGVRVAMGKFDHPAKAPLEENMVVTVPCAAVLAGFYFLWLGAATTFLPLALPYAPRYRRHGWGASRHFPVRPIVGFATSRNSSTTSQSTRPIADGGARVHRHHARHHWQFLHQEYFESAKTVRTLLDGFRMDVHAFSWPTSSIRVQNSLFDRPRCGE